jgi:hypothetical protein
MTTPRRAPATNPPARSATTAVPQAARAPAGVSAETARAWAVRTRREQGLPPVVTDVGDPAA